jgi:VanZ family protein
LEEALTAKTLSMAAGRQAAAWLPAALWMGFIFYVSAQERPPGASQPAVVNVLGHFAEFALLAALMTWAQLFSGWWKKRFPLVLTLALAGAVVYAASDEYHQGFVPTRDAALYDFAVDALGAVAAVVAMWLWARGLLSRRARYRRTVPLVRRKGGAP